MQHLKQHAQDVINGFKRHSTQDARNTLKLCEMVEARDRRITELEGELTKRKSGKIPDFMAGFLRGKK